VRPSFSLICLSIFSIGGPISVINVGLSLARILIFLQCPLRNTLQHNLFHRIVNQLSVKRITKPRNAFRKKNWKTSFCAERSNDQKLSLMMLHKKLSYCGDIARCRQYTIYTVGHKNSATLFSTIILAFLERFLRFLYQQKQESVLYKELTKFTTSLKLCPHNRPLPGNTATI